MPVHVHVPIRLRVPAAALSHRLDDVEAAVREAVARALLTSHDEVLAPRGAYCGVTVHAPSVTWSGDGLGHVSGNTRAHVEAEVAGWVASLAAASPIADVQRAHVQAPEPLPLGPSETVDGSRVWRGFGRYVVPSYGNEGPGREVLTFDEEVMIVDGDAPPAEWEWAPIRTAQDLLHALGDALDRFGMTAPKPGVLGVMYRAGDGNMWIAALRVAANGDVSMRWSFGFELPTRPTVLQSGELELTKVMPSSAVILRLRPLGVRDGPARVALFEECFRAKIVEDLDKIVLSDAMPAGDRQRVVAAQADEHMAALARSAPAGAAFAMLGEGDGSLLLMFPNQAAMQDIEALELLPLARVVTRATTITSEAGGTGFPEDAPIVTEQAQEGPRRFPEVKEPDSELSIERFLGEPSLDALGAIGLELRRLIEAIAGRLDIAVSEYPAGFLLAAETTIAARATAVNEWVETDPAATVPSPGGNGNLGAMQFTPKMTSSIQVLRYLGETTPLLTELLHLLDAIFVQPQYAALIEGRYRDEGPGWLLALHRAHTPIMENAIGLVFVVACRAAMLQLLMSSRGALRGRLDDFDRYSAYFEAIVVTLLCEPARLKGLRDQLQQALAGELQSSEAVASVVVSSWREAREALADAFDSFADAQSSRQVLEQAQIDPTNGALLRDPRGVIVGIRDDKGRQWTLAQLEHAIALQTSNAEAIDPLVKQFVADIPEVATLFRDDPALGRHMLKRKLEEMLAANLEVIGDTLGDLMFAFRAGVIREDLPRANVPGAPGPLCGIHLSAHDLIGDAFLGDLHYEAGVRWLFTIELGRRAIIDFVEMGITFVVAVLCPPLGIVVGAAFAIWHQVEAAGRQQVFEALLDPDFVISHADVELELFLADLGAVLTFLPMAKTVLAKLATTAVSVARVGVRQTVRQGARRVARSLGREAVREALHELRGELAKRVADELVDELVVDNLIGMLLEPAIARVASELQRTSTGTEQLEVSPGDAGGER